MALASSASSVPRSMRSRFWTLAHQQGGCDALPHHEIPHLGVRIRGHRVVLYPELSCRRSTSDGLGRRHCCVRRCGRQVGRGTHVRVAWSWDLVADDECQGSDEGEDAHVRLCPRRCHLMPFERRCIRLYEDVGSNHASANRYQSKMPSLSPATVWILHDSARGPLSAASMRYHALRLH